MGKKETDPKNKAEGLARARLYEDGAKEKYKPSRGEFYAYATHLTDMYNQYKDKDEAIHAKIKKIDNGAAAEDRLINDKERSEIAKLNVYQEKLYIEWMNRMQRYIRNRFGNGAQLEVALADLEQDFHKLMDFADGDEKYQYVGVDNHNIGEDLEMCAPDEDTGNFQILEDIHRYRVVTWRYWNEKAKRKSGDAK